MNTKKGITRVERGKKVAAAMGDFFLLLIRSRKKVAVVATIACCFLLLSFSSSLPLSTSSRWIVDEATGSRVKLACVNWASHLSPMLAEGLHVQPLDSIAESIAAWGFNCVRLTWATFMFTNSTLAEAKVSDTFTGLKLDDALAGIARYNGEMVNMSTVEAFKAVAAGLGRRGVMVVLDNQMSTPGWCCSDTDGNGFWGDRQFDSQLWLLGLTTVASAFAGCSHVVGMSLRNELRGPNQNVPDWYKYMQMGAEAIHGQNPDLLVIHGGLNYAQDLHFLASKPLSETDLSKKIVYELHRYSFTNGDSYTKEDLGEKCVSVVEEMNDSAGFLTTPNQSFTGPLFVSEFGVDQRGISANDNCFLPCFFAFAASQDLDWAYWALQGSYYLRQGTLDADETFGLMNHQWNAPRNISLLEKLQALQQPFVQDIDVSSSGQHQILFHPATGRCVNKVFTNTLVMAPCSTPSRWSLTPQGIIALDSTYLVIGAQGEGLPAVLVLQGSQANGPWRTKSNASTHMQLSTQVAGQTMCLDGSSPPKLFTKSCICLGSQCRDNPAAQWFIFVTSTRSSS